MRVPIFSFFAVIFNDAACTRIAKNAMSEKVQPALSSLTRSNLAGHTKKAAEHPRSVPIRQQINHDTRDSCNSSSNHRDFDGTESDECSLFSKDSWSNNESVLHNPYSFLMQPESCASPQEPKVLVDQFEVAADEMTRNALGSVKDTKPSQETPPTVRKANNNKPTLRSKTTQKNTHLTSVMAHENRAPNGARPLSLKLSSSRRKAAPSSSEFTQRSCPYKYIASNSFDSWDDDWNGWSVTLDGVSIACENSLTNNTDGGDDNMSGKSDRKRVQDTDDASNDENVVSLGFDQPEDVNAMVFELFAADANERPESLVMVRSRHGRYAGLAYVAQNLRTIVRWVLVVAVLGFIGGGHKESIPMYPKDIGIMRKKRASMPPPVRLMNTNPSAFRFKTTTL
jgi:hypothetical protein